MSGIHGAGGAKHARRFYGAVMGEGVGRTGNSYAIPTKDHGLNVLPLDVISYHVENFIIYAQKNPDVDFLLTKVGCGLAGYDWDRDIRPLFPDDMPVNVRLI